jgi:hypothetical protein
MNSPSLWFPARRTSHPRRSPFGVGLAVLAAAVAGCGHRAEVSGTVTLDGVPLKSGVVTFTPRDAGASAYAAIHADGRYTAQTGASVGLAPGDYVVTVAANLPAGEGGPSGPGPYSDGISPLSTPQRYADRSQSPLRALLKSGTQELRLELSSQ